MGHKSSKIKGGGCWGCWGPNATQVGVGIECSFELLSIDLPVLIKDVCVDFRQHLCLGMSRVALGRFEITVVQLQLVRCAGVTQGMENHIRQPCISFQTIERILNHLCFARPPIPQCNHEVVILILAAKEIFLLLLSILPLSQDIGKCFRNP